jgi:glycine/D-amino acid oxidase-like deaminating enzyme
MSDQNVVIVGGAIIGSAVAWFLSRETGFGGNITVIEKDPGYGKCSTTLSLSSIRQQFSTSINIHISRFGFEFLQSLSGRDVSGPDIRLEEQGYLFLASKNGGGQLDRNIELQRGEGVNVERLAAAELGERYPWMNTDDLSIGSLGRCGEGHFDAYTLMQFFIGEAKERGVKFVKGELAKLEMTDSRVRQVILADGRSYECGYLVNAAGTGAAAVAELAGVALPVEPRKRCVFVIDCPAADSLRNCPHLIDYSGVFLKPMGPHFVTGAPPPGEQAVARDDFAVDHALFQEVVWPQLAMRVPVLEELKVVNAWAGHYAYNLFDQNAIIGPHPKVRNLIFANGFSGHGVQQAPAVGRGVAELINHGEYRSLDLSALGFDRILERRPVVELNVI